MSRQWPRLSILPACIRAAGNAGEQRSGEEEGDRVQPVGEVRALNGDQEAADDRADHPRQVLDRLQERRGIRQFLVVDEVRQPGIDRGSEEARRDTAQRREEQRSGGAAGERQEAEDHDTDEIGHDQQPLT